MAVPGPYYTGSPPRRWGIRAIRIKGYGVPRFTPTQVGNTLRERHKASRSTVHPHAGGEYAWYSICPAKAAGSPPRRWGILSYGFLVRAIERFTPTQVGNTSFRMRHSFRRTVHPHAGGEYGHGISMMGKDTGSPPRRWGILCQAKRWQFCHRFTPTQVGNTDFMKIGVNFHTVHPHAGGEYSPRTLKV